MSIIFYKRDATFEPGPANPESDADTYIEIPIVNNTVDVVDTLKEAGYSVSESEILILTGNLNTPLQDKTSVGILNESGKIISASGNNVYELLNEFAKQLSRP